jgi:hypothetical protein
MGERSIGSGPSGASSQEHRSRAEHRQQSIEPSGASSPERQAHQSDERITVSEPSRATSASRAEDRQRAERSTISEPPGASPRQALVARLQCEMISAGAVSVATAAFAATSAASVTAASVTKTVPAATLAVLQVAVSAVVALSTIIASAATAYVDATTSTAAAVPLRVGNTVSLNTQLLSIGCANVDSATNDTANLRKFQYPSPRPTTHASTHRCHHFALLLSRNTRSEPLSSTKASRRETSSTGSNGWVILTRGGNHFANLRGSGNELLDEYHAAKDSQVYNWMEGE